MKLIFVQPITGVTCYGGTTAFSVSYAPGFSAQGATFASVACCRVSPPMTITFTKPVTSFTLTFYDPTYTGNSVTATDIYGQSLPTQSVPGNNKPGTLTIQTVTVTANQFRPINKILLTPAALDYVSYKIVVDIEAVGAAHIPVTIYGQADSRWGGDDYDHSIALKIRGKGCALSSMSMALSRYDTTLTPGWMNTFMRANQGYKGTSVNWPTAIKNATNGTKRYNSVGQDTASINAEIRAGYPVIVGVKLSPDGPGHFVLITGIEANGRHSIADPAGGILKILEETTDYVPYSVRGSIRPVTSFFQAQASGGSISQTSVPTVNGDLVIMTIDGQLRLSNYLGQFITSVDTVSQVNRIPDSYGDYSHLDNDETGEVDEHPVAWVSAPVSDSSYTLTATYQSAFSGTIDFGYSQTDAYKVSIPVNLSTGGTLYFTVSVGSDGTIIVTPL